ncbi:phosphopantetheine-binding protein [Nocardioides sp. TF02-7]|uniref:phosphopantetheine-binding protein n=1 Tax=Nocardioides sp. TF02-7 TaxID=2917724 RepID=UPI001F06B071|nr:phosphopantetheine-binding protein [Nocardioides sp. TF02-7]UMG91125.1 phosphopantetheine-binding protein [Nocardioides sp. TF02-7]
MDDVQNSVLKIIGSLLEGWDRTGVTVDAGTTLHGEEGLGLDSLETAELSATLEDEFGSDPFSAGEMPETVGEIVAFYAAAA